MTKSTKKLLGKAVPELSRLDPNGTPKRWLHSCELGHQFRSRTRSSGTCPYCTNREVLTGFNDLRSHYPLLADEMDHAENELLSTEILYGSNTHVNWKSMDCGHYWGSMSPNSRTRGGQGCPIEAGKRNEDGTRAKVGTILETYKDVVAKSWAYDLNSQDPATARLDLTAYWWRCSLGHSYKRNIYKEVNNGCPVCSGHKVDPRNRSFWSECIALDREDLLKEWDSELNSSGPEDYSPYSSSKVQWLCLLGHSWRATIAGRWSRSCPGCGRKRLEPGYNDLKTFCSTESSSKHLLTEWDYANNGELEDYTSRSSSVVHWICSKNKDHTWRTSIANRTAGSACPKCKESKVENEVRAFLEELVGEQSEKNRSLLNGKEIDILFPKRKIGVEVNGDYWHSKALKADPYSYHLHKRLLATEKGVDLAFVWESDWRAQRKEVEDSLKRLFSNGTMDVVLQTLSKD